MKDKNCVYIMTKNDDLELPMVVTDTLEEMSFLTGFSIWSLFRHLVKNSVINKKYRIRQVDVRDPEEKFQFDEYKKFCKKVGISPANFESLKRFRRDCFGV